MSTSMTKSDQTKLKLTALIGLCALSFMGMSQGALSPAIANFAQIWPEHIANIALINTMPNLLCIPCAVLSGRLADKGILSYKQLALLAVGICAVSGIVPAFFCTDFFFILAARALFGVGMGFFQPICASVILLLVPGDRARHYLSITSAASSLGGILFQVIGGLLCDIATNLTFLAYIMAVVSWILILLFLPNPPRAVKDTAGKKREPMGMMVLFWGIMNMLFSGVFFIMTNNMSFVVINNNMGTAADAAFALSLFTVGALVGSILSHQIFRIFKNFTMTACCVIGIIGYIILTLGNSIGFMYLGCFLFGLGFGSWNPCLQTYTGRSVPESMTSTALSLVMCCAGIGNFLSAYLVNGLNSVFHGSDRFGFILGAAIFAVMGIVLAVVGIRMTVRERQNAAE